MKKFSKLALLIGSALLSYSTFAAIPNTDDPTTFLGPTARLGFTSTLNDTMAYNLSGEAGFKNFRVGATWGWKIAEDQRLKLSADYLWQEITYAFFSGNTDQWVRQASISGAYQYDYTGMAYAPQFDLNGYFASAPSKNLSTKFGSFINPFGVLTTYADFRRIAGSDAWGLAPGVSIAPWDGGRVGVELNYDNVDYRQKFSSPSQDATGFGGTVRLKQAIADNLGFNLAAAIRKPFNNYAGELNWMHVPFYGDWTLGLFGDYTAGKNTLPNTWNVGVSANYMLDTRCPVAMPRSLKGDLKGETMVPITDNLLEWTARPAVYLPQVLAIADGTTYTFSGCPDGAAPTFSGPIDDQLTADATDIVDLTPFFAGNNLIFSLASISPTLDPADSVAVSTSGILTFDTSSDFNVYVITVRATNSCGTVVSNSFEVGGAPA